MQKPWQPMGDRVAAAGGLDQGSCGIKLPPESPIAALLYLQLHQQQGNHKIQPLRRRHTAESSTSGTVR